MPAPGTRPSAAGPVDIEIRHFHLFCGVGGGARGFNRGAARVGTLRARFRCLGGIDVDPAATRDFARLAGVPGTCLDLFGRAQYQEFHGREPPPGWREATATDIQYAAGFERPHIVFLSAPCKGFSGLLSEKQSASGRYQALNALTLRGVWLMLEAWADDPPELIVFENVPRIANRGRALLDRIGALLRHHGYAVAETTHDCGELGGLAQSRKRFLLVARHIAKVPPFLYEPGKHRLRGVGEVLDKLPLPLSGLGGPMHRMPALHWKTWVRLAFVEAGSDWRSLNRLRVADGFLADYGIVPDAAWQADVLGVRRWDEPTGVVAGRSSPTNGAYAVADPRGEGWHHGPLGVNAWEEPSGSVTSQGRATTGKFAVADPRRIDGRAEFGQYGVKGWQETSQTVIGKAAVGAGNFSVADPRIQGRQPYNHVYRIVAWNSASPAVTGANGGTASAVADPRAATGFGGKGKYQVAPWQGPANTVIAASSTGHGASAVADPRVHATQARRSRLGLLDWHEPSGTIAGESLPSNGAFSVADPRPNGFRDDRENYATGGHYGVIPYDAPSGAVTASGQHDNGRWSVADPRDPAEIDANYSENYNLPAAGDRLVCVIRALDGTWHRPFTTLELAALQSLVDPEEHLELDGLSDSAWRERIGNAVPPAAAQAIASVMGRTLLLAWSGQSFMLSAEPIWVQPIALALSVSPSTAFSAT